jgi:hypothetical protein
MDRNVAADDQEWVTSTRALGYAALCGLLAAGCGSSPDPADPGAWEGSVETVDNVTTVRNLSGSVWGGTATLVEEASIGVDEGAEEYMLGRVNGIWASDENIFVLEAQLPAVRVYDYGGTYVRQIGRGGEGPGEYASPMFLGGDDQGRIFVADYGTQRIALFSATGDDLGVWHMGTTACCMVPMVVTGDGQAYLQTREPDPDTGMAMNVLQAHSADGPSGEERRPPALEVPQHMIDFQERRMPVVFAPEIVWELGRDGQTVAGASHEYQFAIQHPDGSTVRVEREYAPVPVSSEEREWYRRSAVTSLRRGDPGWNWDGAEMPAVKPAFTRFLFTQTGRLWVVRPGPGRRLPGCDPDVSMDDFRTFQEAACWRDTELVDVFDVDGRYLGDIDVPDEVNLRFATPWIKDDVVIANVYDASGVIRVVRYRIALPEPGN